jgi:hypothetical protein
VDESTSYGKAGLELVLARLRDIYGCDESLLRKYLDGNIYDRSKGIKPDVRPHPSSKLWPAPVGGSPHLHVEDPSLTAQIKQHWQWVVSNAPASLGVPAATAPARHTASRSASTTATPFSASSTPHGASIVERVIREFGALAGQPKQIDARYLSMTLASRFCVRLGREHGSNHAYVSVDLHTNRVTRKCHDPDCKGDLAFAWPQTELQQPSGDASTATRADAIFSPLEPPSCSGNPSSTPMVVDTETRLVPVTLAAGPPQQQMPTVDRSMIAAFVRKHCRLNVEVDRTSAVRRDHACVDVTVQLPSGTVTISLKPDYATFTDQK